MDELISVLKQIEAHLAVLAEYAAMLRAEKTGEKIYEVRDYVVSRTSRGDAVVYLYATHPGLQYRVCSVYAERLHELPFSIPERVKVWDGDAAPTRESAARKGYLLSAPAPFRVALLPTGALTDAGLPVYRFHRVVETGEQPAQPEQPEQPPQPEQPEQPPQPEQPEQPPQPTAWEKTVRAAAEQYGARDITPAQREEVRRRFRALFPNNAQLADAAAYLLFRRRFDELAGGQVLALREALQGRDDEVRQAVKAFLNAHRGEFDLVRAALEKGKA